MLWLNSCTDVKMSSVKLLFIQCTLLLILGQIRSEEIQRDKRDLKLIKNFLSSTIFGHEPVTNEVLNVKEDHNNINVPKGYKVIYVKRVPGTPAVHHTSAINSKINIIKAFIGTKNVNETKKAIESAKDLIQSGILPQEEVVPLRVGSSQMQFKEIFKPEQQGFFSSELHAPSHFAPKPFVNSLSSFKVEAPFVISSSAPPHSSFGEQLNSSLAVSSLPNFSLHHFNPIITVPSVGSRFSYKQSYHDGSNVVYDGSIRTGDKIPQQITNDIKYVMPPPFFIDRLQNIAIVPTISEPVKPAYSYKIIHNHGSTALEHKLPLTVPLQNVNSFSQQPSPQSTTSIESEKNVNIVQIHPYPYVLSHAIPFQTNFWQSPIMPHFYRYIQTYTPPKSPPIAVNFNPKIRHTNNNQDIFKKVGTVVAPYTPVETDYLNIHKNNHISNNINIAENHLSNIDTLPKSYVKYFKPEAMKIPDFSSQTVPQLVEKVNNNYASTNRYTFTQKDSSGNNIIYKNDQVIVKNNPYVSPIKFKSVSLNDKQELPLATPNEPTNSLEADNHLLPKISNKSKFSTTIDTDLRSNFPFTNTLSETTHLPISTQEIEYNHSLPKESIGTFTANGKGSVTDEATVPTKRRKILRKVKVKQNAIRNFKTYEAPSNNDNNFSTDTNESLNNKPIVVLPQAESSFSYKQINGDGSTRTIYDNENNGVFVDVQKNTENVSHRGDIPL